jgi:tetratricopeptide (TPR) repeat protein
MRWREVALLLALCLPACLACSTAERRLPQLHDEAREAILRGALPDALVRIEQGRLAAGDAAPEWRWQFRLLHAEVLLLQREIPAAVALLASSSPDDTPPDTLVARRTYLIARARSAQGEFPEAMAALADARRQAAAAQARPAGVAGVAEDILFDIDALQGQMLLRTGRWQEAEPVLQQVLARATAQGNRYYQAVALHNLGSGRVVRSRFDEALAFFEQLIALKQLEPYAVYATALSNAGLCYARLGQFDNAAAIQRRAIAIHEKRGISTYLEQALGELGNTYVLREDPRQGMAYLRRAFEMAEAAGLTADAALWAGNLAEAAADLGHFDEADRFNRDAIRLADASRGQRLYTVLNSGQIAAGRGRLEDAGTFYREALQSATDDPAVRWEAYTGLAKVALASGDAAAAMRHFESAVHTIQLVRSDLQKAEYRLTFLARVLRFYQDYVDTLVSAGNVTRALEVADSSRAVVLAERMGGSAQPHTVRAKGLVAAAARSRSVWLAYWLAPARSYLWVVTPGGIRCLTLPGEAVIAQHVEAHRAMVERTSTDPLATPGSPGDALYAAVLAPAAPFIPVGSSVRIVPDGALHGVNFETLPVDGPRRRYWIEDVTVAIAPSLGLLASAPAAAPGTADGIGSLLLVGDPTPRLREFPRLGYAAVEMQAVSKHFGARAVTFNGDRASPAEYLAARPERFSVIHFTAHAAANQMNPLESAVILAGPAGADKLYARDVSERPLSAALVTISACRSAGERAYAGEGLIGFAWAFLRAGARQVIAGLWDVDDQSTAALMDTLYAGIARGETPPAALRAAKLALIGRGGHVARPYYWGPFEVFTVTP